MYVEEGTFLQRVITIKHVFVINDHAGRGEAERAARAARTLCGMEDCVIYRTDTPADATAFVRKYCEEHGDPVRFYACGGDGTLQSVANGVVGFPHASMTAYACGSGNDFVKYYGGQQPFLKIEELLQAQDMPVDLIKVSGHQYALNACHFGFDSAVASFMNKVRRHKLFGGKRAYPTAVAKALFCNMVTRCTVTVDGEVLNPAGKLLLCTVANGQFVGGSYRCAPRSKNDDGLLEVCLVKPVSRLRFLQLMDAYKEGRHLTDPRFDDVIVYRRGSEVHISSPDPQFACSLDGEVLYDSELSVSVAEKAIRFSVPASAAPIGQIEKEEALA